MDLFHWVTKLTWIVILIYRLVHFIFFFCYWILIFKIVYTYYTRVIAFHDEQTYVHAGSTGWQRAHTPIPEKFKLVKLGPILEKKLSLGPHPPMETTSWSANVTWRFKAYPVDFKKGKDKVFASIFLFYTLVLQLCRPSMQKSVVSWKTKWIRVHCANTISQYRSILLILINI